MDTVEPYIWDTLDDYFVKQKLGVNIVFNMLDNSYGGFRITLTNANSFPYEGKGLEVAENDNIIIVGTDQSGKDSKTELLKLVPLIPTAAFKSTTANRNLELYAPYHKNVLVSTFATIREKASAAMKTVEPSKYNDDNPKLIVKLQIYAGEESQKTTLIPTLIHAFGLSAIWSKHDAFEISAGEDAYRQFTATAKTRGLGGGKRANPSAAKWIRTSRKVDVKQVKKTVYRNSKTGELRVRKLVARPNGSKRVSYVKF